MIPFDVLLIASSKSRSARGASHQPAFMSSCLTISHTCLSCLVSGRTLLFLSDLFIVGRVVFCFWCQSTKLRSGMCSRFSCVSAGMERLSLDLTEAVKIVAGCGSVWNSWSQTELSWKLNDFTILMKSLACGDQWMLLVNLKISES